MVKLTNTKSAVFLPTDSWGHYLKIKILLNLSSTSNNSIAWCWGGTEVTGADLAAVNVDGDLPLSCCVM